MRETPDRFWMSQNNRSYLVPKDLFRGASYKDIRLSDMLEELDREIKVRRRLYPKWIKKGSLDPVTADRRILCLQAIRRRLAG